MSGRTGLRAGLRPRLAAAVIALALTSGCAAAGAVVGVHAPGDAPMTGPAVEPQQGRAILGRVLDVANQADKERNVDLAAQAYDGLALQVATTAYSVDSALGTTVPSRPTSNQRPAVVLTRGTAYPRFFFAVLAGTKNQPAVVSVLTATSAAAAYRIDGTALMLPGARLPDVADVSEGSPVLAPGTAGLVVAPGDLATKYAAVLNTGSTAPEAASFGNDEFAQQVQAAAAAQRQQVARFGTYTQTHDIVPGAVLAIRTSDGGALVYVELRRTSTFAGRAGNLASLPPDVRVLTGTVQSSTFSSVSAEMLVFVDPPAGKGRVTLVAATDGLISATAH